MITKISGLNTSGSANATHRKSQSTNFRNTSNIPFQGGYKEHSGKQADNAMLTSVSIVAGSILFTIAYFMLSAITLNLKK